MQSYIVFLRVVWIVKDVLASLTSVKWLFTYFPKKLTKSLNL